MMSKRMPSDNRQRGGRWSPTRRLTADESVAIERRLRHAVWLGHLSPPIEHGRSARWYFGALCFTVKGVPMKRPLLKKQLEMIEERLVAAGEYVAQNVNVEGSSFLASNGHYRNAGCWPITRPACRPPSITAQSNPLEVRLQTHSISARTPM